MKNIAGKIGEYSLKMNNLLVSILLLSFCLIAQPSCIAASREALKPPVTVGFILCGPITELGWNTAHNDGRLYLEKTMNGKVKTIYAEKIPENSEAARVMERMIAQGAKVIFLTSYGYLEPGLKVAAHHPEVIFMQVNRFSDQPLPNVGVYYSFYYEPLYAAGIVAGRMTKTNNIGFVLGHPVPPLLGGMNVFTLGAHSVNPKVKVHMVFTNSWDDPSAEAEATRGLIERGADVIGSNLDNSLVVCHAADKAGAYSIGTHYDLNNQVPKSWLVGQCHNWGPLYVKVIQSVIDGSWKPGTKTHHVNEGCTQLSSFGKVVPPKVIAEALQAEQKIKSGKLVIFKGPLKDRDGHERLSKGQTISDKDLSKIDWVVEGVEGTLPKSK